MVEPPCSVLAELAIAHGIQPHWHDIEGAKHVVGYETLRALLVAQGVAAATDAEVKASLDAARSARWNDGLPSLVTAEAGRTVDLELCLPDETGDELPWSMCGPDIGTLAGRSLALAIDTDSGRRRRRCRLALPAPRHPGYASLEIAGQIATLAVAPATCHGASMRSAWGLAAPVHGLHANGDDGLGHYGAVAAVAREAAAQGADALALSPMHALFAADPGHVSPYSPSNRAMLNGLLCDPCDIPGVPTDGAKSAGAPDAVLETGTPLIDYGRALVFRRERLREGFERFATTHLGASPTVLGLEFAAFRQNAGQALEDHARFEALHAFHFGRAGAWRWRDWAPEYRCSRHPAVAQFAREHAQEVSFHAFLQWLANFQVARSQAAARAGGMKLGLLADLAVGTHPDGSRAWSEPDALLTELTIGAPPDPFSPRGQGWGLTAFSPRGLAARGFAPFLDDLRVAMRNAGGVRLDHILGFVRLWCIPTGASPVEGAYLSMPYQDLVRLTMLESTMQRSIVVGEDLGTVPAGLREDLTRRKIFGIRVLWFEKDAAGSFASPAAYSADAVATITTHDLPTAAGWWDGLDIAWRERLNLLSPTQAETARAERKADRVALWQALCHEGLSTGDVPPDAFDAELAAALAAYVGSTPSPLVLLQIEDVLLEREQPNLPGTTSEHPNWRRRLPAETAGALRRRPASLILGALARARRARGQT